IHAPARGATKCGGVVFNRFPISIHAPARGATFLLLRRTQTQVISIHAPARGATLGSVLLCVNVLLFQSTLPHGERPLEFVIPYPETKISIHAPARGATYDCTIIVDRC